MDLELWSYANPAPVRGSLFPAPPVARLELRDYQREALQAIRDARAAGHKRAALVMATGAGKTVVFCAAVQDVQPKRVLILTDQTDLISQTVERLQEATGIVADIEQDSSRATNRAQVVVATVQTMKGRLAWWAKNHFDLVVADECDRAMAPTWQAVLNHFDGHAFVLGVTATPKRSDKKSILTYFERIVYRLAMVDLISRGYLVPIEAEHVPIELDLRGVKTTGGDYAPAEVGSRIEDAFGKIIQAWQDRAGNLRTLFFLPDIQTCGKFVNVANGQGHNFRYIHSKLHESDKRALKRAFRERRFMGLANPMLLGRGYDDPGIECVVNLRATKSISLYQQICGRGTRLFCPHGCRNQCDHPERKQRLLVLDFLWQFDDMGPLGPGALLAEDEERQKQIAQVIREHQGAINLQEAAAEATRRSEEAILKALAAAQTSAGAGKKLYFRVPQFAVTFNQRHLLEYLPEGKDAAPPTPNQLHQLADKGFYPEEIDSQGLAKELLRICKDRSSRGLASFKQIHWLIKRGARGVDNLTRSQAGALLDRAFAGESLRGQDMSGWNDHGVVDLGPDHDHEVECQVCGRVASVWPKGQFDRVCERCGGKPSKRVEPPPYEFDQPF